LEYFSDSKRLQIILVAISRLSRPVAASVVMCAACRGLFTRGENSPRPRHHSQMTVLENFQTLLFEVATLALPLIHQALLWTKCKEEEDLGSLQEAAMEAAINLSLLPRVQKKLSDGNRMLKILSERLCEEIPIGASESGNSCHQKKPNFYLRGLQLIRNLIDPLNMTEQEYDIVVEATITVGFYFQSKLESISQCNLKDLHQDVMLLVLSLLQTLTLTPFISQLHTRTRVISLTSGLGRLPVEGRNALIGKRALELQSIFLNFM